MKKRQQAERHGRRRQQCDRAGFPLPDITSSSVYNATLEFIFFEVHAALNRVACRYASNRASPRRPKLLLPALRSPLFCDAFAALREGEQYRKCVVCGQIMDKWDSTNVPTFKLIHRPDDA
jgi:hypothetical protein